MSDKNNNACEMTETQKNIYRQKIDMAMAGTDTTKKRRSAIAIMGSLIGSYFNMYDWNNGSVISMILLILILLLSMITGEFSDKEGDSYD